MVDKANKHGETRQQNMENCICVPITQVLAVYKAKKHGETRQQNMYRPR